MSNKKKLYFLNLDGLRFIAASLVIIHHIEQFKSFFLLDNYYKTIPFVFIIGKLGVVLFFVLSGFLITYLLLTEEKFFKRINISNFYVRRILRIWPLYFLIIILTFFVLPNFDLFYWPEFDKTKLFSHFYLKLFLYVFFLPNVLGIFGFTPYAAQLWSIGTEEQFYLMWPVILNFFKKHRGILLLSIIFFYQLISFVLYYTSNGSLLYRIIIQFWKSFNIDCMAIGGLYSLLLFNNHSINKYLLNEKLFYVILSLVFLFLITGIAIPYFHYQFYAIIFGFIILNFAANKSIKITLEYSLLKYLGNISYGLYMYHPIGIILALIITISINLTSNWLIYPLSFILTIIIAGVSYKYFESFFLGFKNRFSNILSGNNIKELS